MTEDQIKNSERLSALAHPLRRRLADILRAYGPATASTLAERTGQAVGNVSHHLRVLGAAGIIEEAPELARDKRERWWRRSSENLSWNRSDFASDPAAALVSQTVQSMLLDRHTAAAREWLLGEQSEEWVDTSFVADRWLMLTPEELEEMAREIIAVQLKWGTREIPDDGRERQSVLVFSYGMPAQP
ncbi:ArsR/SmtB family transcription factor [Kitasatospora sp. NPDC051853]|uniref:ArsR/SmtB family transcription factor n=1 Tax=Kitasatospora sp. NPDC051853 TaxID=3364058 RepID=UPI0037A784E6